MSWLSALKPLHTLYTNGKKVKQVYDYAKKVEKADEKKLSWDQLKFFNNKTMNTATKMARDAKSSIKKALKAELAYPTSGTLKAFIALIKISQKQGLGSKQYEAGKKTYIAAIKTYDKDLRATLAALKSEENKLLDNLRTATALRDYADVLQKAFFKCAKIPAGPSTAQNAMFFSLSQDAQQYGGIMSDVVKDTQKLIQKNKGYIKDVQTKIKENGDWLTWAQSDAPNREGNLKKNEKATKPKK